MKIKLSQGFHALIDDEDLELISQYKWHYSKQVIGGYAVSTKYEGGGRSNPKYSNIMMHRLIMNTPDGLQTDHINHNKLDNRKSNLRVCTRSQNLKNQNKRVTNKSGYKGVCWDKTSESWIAQVGDKSRTIVIGRFKDAKTAAIAYDEFVVSLFGEYANPNGVS